MKQIVNLFTICFIMTNKEKVIRLQGSDIRISSRSTQGVILLKVGQEEIVTGVTKVEEIEKVLGE